MRSAIAPTLVLLLLPLAAWGQEQATSDVGHFEGWPGLPWGADKQAFDAKFGIRRMLATFTVAKNGFGWHLTFTNMEETLNPWENVIAWCWGPGTVSVRTSQQSARSLGFYDLEPEDLVTIVDEYFKKYVPEVEWSAPNWECTPAALRRPHPADMAKIIELLEAASSQEPIRPDR